MFRVIRAAWFSLLVFTLFSISSYSMPTAGVPILIEPVPTNNPHKIAFTVSVLNQGTTPLEIKNEDFSEVVNYKAPGFNWKENTELVSTKASYIILAGEKKVLHYFEHDLEKYPSNDDENFEIQVEVKGVGSASYSFELSKPNFFESAMNRIFGEGSRNTAKNTSLNSAKSSGNERENYSAQPGNLHGVKSQKLPGSQNSTEGSRNYNLEGGGSPLGSSAQSFSLESTSVTQPHDSHGIKSGGVQLQDALQTQNDSRPQLQNSSEPAAPQNEDAPQQIESESIIEEQVNVAAPIAPTQNNVSFVAQNNKTPEISNIEVRNVGASVAHIWVNGKYGNSYSVDYSDGSNNYVYRSKSNFGTQRLVLEGLASATNYNFTVSLSDLSGNVVTSSVYSFRTLAEITSQVGHYSDAQNMDELASLNGWGWYRQPLSLGDLNGDGLDELLFTVYEQGVSQVNQYGDKGYDNYLVFSKSDGSYDVDGKVFMYSFSPSPAFNGYEVYKVGDFNRDGFEDLLFYDRDRVASGQTTSPFGALGNSNPAWWASRVSLFTSRLQNGSVTYAQAQEVISVADDQEWVTAFGDWNGDGLMDFASSSDFGKMNFVLSNANSQNYGSLGTRMNFPNVASNTTEELVQNYPDVNNDGLEEMILVTKQGIRNADEVRLYTSPNYLNGAPQVVHKIGHRMQSVTLDVKGDLNGDGTTDLLLATNPYDDDRLLIFMNADGTQQSFHQDSRTFLSYELVDDLDGDGLRDAMFFQRLVAPEASYNHQFSFYYSDHGNVDYSADPDFSLPASVYGYKVIEQVENGETKYHILSARQQESSLSGFDYYQQQ